MAGCAVRATWPRSGCTSPRPPGSTTCASWPTSCGSKRCSPPIVRPTRRPPQPSLLGEQPLREHARRLGMLGLYRSGRHAEALRLADEGRRTMRDLGLSPSPELAELEQAILDHDPRLLAAGVGACGRRRCRWPARSPTGHGPGTAGHAVRRARPRSWLTSARSSTPWPAERTPVVIIEGEAGIGKTRLASRDRRGGPEPPRRPRGVGPRAGRGRGRPVLADRRAAPRPRRRRRGSQPRRGRAAQPELAVLLGGGSAPADELGRELARTRLLDARGRPPRRGSPSAAGAPVVLVVDDLHWVDPDSLAVLGALARRQPGSLLVLATTTGRRARFGHRRRRRRAPLAIADAAPRTRSVRLASTPSKSWPARCSTHRRTGRWPSSCTSAPRATPSSRSSCCACSGQRDPPIASMRTASSRRSCSTSSTSACNGCRRPAAGCSRWRRRRERRSTPTLSARWPASTRTRPSTCSTSPWPPTWSATTATSGGSPTRSSPTAFGSRSPRPGGRACTTASPTRWPAGPGRGRCSRSPTTGSVPSPYTGAEPAVRALGIAAEAAVRACAIDVALNLFEQQLDLLARLPSTPARHDEEGRVLLRLVELGTGRVDMDQVRAWLENASEGERRSAPTGPGPKAASSTTTLSSPRSSATSTGPATSAARSSPPPRRPATCRCVRSPTTSWPCTR